MLLTGCPLKNKVPVDDGMHTPESRLTGNWTNFETPLKKYSISAPHDGKYTVLERAQKSDGKVKETMYYATISDVAGTRFMNIFDTSADEPGYYIYKIEDLTAKKLVLLPLTEKSVHPMNGKGELSAWLRVNKDRANFYDVGDLAVYVK